MDFPADPVRDFGLGLAPTSLVSLFGYTVWWYSGAGMNSEAIRWIDRTPGRRARNAAIASLALMLLLLRLRSGEASALEALALIMVGVTALLGFLMGLAARRQLWALRRIGDEALIRGLASLPLHYAALTALAAALIPLSELLFRWGDFLPASTDKAVGHVVAVACLGAVAGGLVGWVLQWKLQQRMAAPMRDGTERATEPLDATGANYFARHWRGQLSLPLSYWVNGMVGTAAAHIVVFLSAFVLSALDLYPGELVFLVALFPLLLWQSVGIWRSATNYREAKPTKIWGGFAKAVVILIALRFLVEVVASIVGLIEGSPATALG